MLHIIAIVSKLIFINNEFYQEVDFNMEDDGNADTSTYCIFIPWYHIAKKQRFSENYVNFEYIGRSPCLSLEDRHRLCSFMFIFIITFSSCNIYTFI